jgi:hypothetical protein
VRAGLRRSGASQSRCYLRQRNVQRIYAMAPREVTGAGRVTLSLPVVVRVVRERQGQQVARLRAPRRTGTAPRAPRSRRVRSSRTSHGPPRLSADDDPDLVAQLASLIGEHGPLPASWLRCQVRRRKTTVLMALRVGPFVMVGKGRAAKWDVAPEPTELEQFHEGVWKARRSGLIDAYEALELLLEPPPRVLAMLAEVAA